ncbi:MAG: hypothetical protein OJF47_002723 [Nitrospira sp.]|nr:MAG: hypothetical protein OJF47_002723 [Nitrospira sp.]
MTAAVVLHERSGPHKASYFSEEQMVYAVCQAEDNTPVSAVCHQSFGGLGLAKNNLRPARRWELAGWFQDTFHSRFLQTHRLAQFGRDSWYRRSCAKNQSTLHRGSTPIPTGPTERWNIDFVYGI